VQLKSDTEDPKRTKLRNDKDELRDATPKIDIDAPSRENDRSDNVDPREMKSRTDNEELNL